MLNTPLKKVEPFADCKGFTMIEVLIAMVIFLIGFLAVGAMQISSVNGNASARMRTEATAIAAQHAERFLAMDFADIDASLADYPVIQGPYTIDTPEIISRSDTPELTAANNRTINITILWKKRGEDRSLTYSLVAVDM
jgi:prepilin-type N-terminal cleavage/methylation domain-containing protein